MKTTITPRAIVEIYAKAEDAERASREQWKKITAGGEIESENPLQFFRAEYDLVKREYPIKP